MMASTSLAALLSCLPGAAAALRPVKGGAGGTFTLHYVDAHLDLHPGPFDTLPKDKLANRARQRLRGRPHAPRQTRGCIACRRARRRGKRWRRRRHDARGQRFARRQARGVLAGSIACS